MNDEEMKKGFEELKCPTDSISITPFDFEKLPDFPSLTHKDVEQAKERVKQHLDEIANNSDLNQMGVIHCSEIDHETFEGWFKSSLKHAHDEQMARRVYNATVDLKLSGRTPKILIVGNADTSSDHLMKLLEKIDAEVEFRDISNIDQGGVYSLDMVIIDELAVPHNVKNGRHYGRALFMPPETTRLGHKRSQSDNPSDRWIKPKKLRRAKGGRK